jgi:hypothetical protein
VADTSTQQLEAGRALDALIAEKVMGFVRVRVPKDYDGQNGGEVLVPRNFPSDCSWAPKGAYGFHCFVPRYSFDIVDAVRVFECLAFCSPKLHRFVCPDRWLAEMQRRDESGEWVSATAANAPLAICLAALKAVGA